MSRMRFSSGVEVYTIMQRLMFWVRGMLIGVVDRMRPVRITMSKDRRMDRKI